MDISVVKEMILGQIEDAQITVEGEDCSFSVTVVSDQFQGKLPVARQKSVLSIFKEQLATGDLHALSVKALTPAEVN